MNTKHSIFVPKTLAVLVWAAFAATAIANPVGPQVVNGQVSTARPDAATLNITNSPGAILNWNGFSIQSGETTRFIQQSANSAVLNRVTGSDVSSILGQLQSNGRVFLVNPNGIIFGKGSVVDTAGLIASSLNITDADFLAGRYRFTGNAASGAVSNYGTLFSNGGAIYLFSPDVQNHGLIDAPGGQVVLAAGRSISIGGPGLGDLQFEIQAPTDRALNLGTLRADDGAVGMFASSLQQSGTIQANAWQRDAGGQIVLLASEHAEVSGSLSAQGKSGGSIEVLGNSVALVDHARLDVSGSNAGGTILVGGDFQGKNPAIRNASETRVEAGVELLASVSERGNGGKVVVWADQATDFAGQIVARGGRLGGDGGQVEVSGKQRLVFAGQVDTTASLGRIGNLLLDPYDIYVISGGGAAPLLGSSAASLPANSLSIDPAALAALATDVTLAAGHDINFLSALTLAKHALTANAGHDLNVQAAITTGGGALSLTAGNALSINDSLSTAGGAVSLRAGSGGIDVGNSIFSGGGAIALLTTAGGGISIDNGVNSQGGTLTVNAANGISVGGSGVLNSSGNTLQLTASNGNIVLASDATVRSNGGNMDVSAANGNISGNGDYLTVGGNLTMTARGVLISDGLTSGSISTGSGNVSLTATAGNIAVGYLSDGGPAPALTSSGTLRAQASGSVNIYANNDLQAVSVTAGSGNSNLYASGNLTVGSATTDGNIGLEANHFSLTSALVSGTVNSTNGNVTLGSGGQLTLGLVTAGGGAISATSYNGDIVSAPAPVGSLLTANRITLDAGNNGAIGSTATPVNTVASELTLNARKTFNVANSGALSRLTFNNIQQIGTTSGASQVTASNLTSFDLVETAASGGDLLIKQIAGNNINLEITRQGQVSNTIQIADSDSTTPTINLVGVGSRLALNAGYGSGDIRALSSINPAIAADQVSLRGAHVGFLDDGGGWSGAIITRTPDLAVSADSFLVDNQMQLERLDITTSASGIFNSGHATIAAVNLPTCGGSCVISTSGGELNLTSDGTAVTLPGLNVVDGFSNGLWLTLTSGDLLYSNIVGGQSATINGTTYSNVLFPGALSLAALSGSISPASAGVGDIKALGAVSLQGSASGGAVSANSIVVGGAVSLTAGSIAVTGDINAGGDVTLTGVDFVAPGDINIANINAGGSVGLTANGNVVLGDVSAVNDINLQAGLDLTTNGLTSSAGSISLSGAAITANGAVSAAVDLNANANGDLSVTGTSTATTAGGNMSLIAGGNLTLTSTAATTAVGSMSLVAGGQITANNTLTAPILSIASGAALGSAGTPLQVDTGATGDLTLNASNGTFNVNNAGTLSRLALTTSGTAAGSTSTLSSSGIVFASFDSAGADLVVSQLQQSNLNLSLTAASGGVQIAPGAIAVGNGPVNITALAAGLTSGITQTPATGGPAITTSGTITLNTDGQIGSSSVPLTTSGSTQLDLTSGDQIFLNSSTALTSLRLTLPAAGTPGTFGVIDPLGALDPSGALASFNRPASGPLALTGVASGNTLGDLNINVSGDFNVTGNVILTTPGAGMTLHSSGILAFAPTLTSGALTVSAETENFQGAAGMILDASSADVEVLAVGAQTLDAGSGSLSLLGGAGHALLSGGTQDITVGTDFVVQGGGNADAYARVAASGDQTISVGGNMSLKAGVASGAFAEVSAAGWQNNFSVGGSLSLVGAAADNAYARLAAGTGQNLQIAGNISLTGATGGAAAPAYARIENAAGTQQISSGSLTLNSASNGAAEIINNGSGDQLIYTSALTMSSPNSAATNADVRIVSGGYQFISAGAISLLNQHGDPSGLVAIDAGGNQDIYAAYLDLQTGINGAGAVRVQAGGNQTIQLYGANNGRSLNLFAAGSGSSALVEATGTQLLTITDPVSAGSFWIDAGQGTARLNGIGGQTLVSNSLTVQAGTVDAANADIASGGTQTISTLLGGISVLGTTSDLATGNSASIDPPSTQSIVSAGNIDVTGGGNNSSAVIASGGTQSVVATLGGINVAGGTGSNATAAVSSAGQQTVQSVVGAVNVLGGSGGGATAGIQAGGSQVVSAGTDIAITAGAGAGASASISGDTVSITAAGNIVLDATANGLISFAALFSNVGSLQMTAGGQIRLLQGSSATNSDAFVTVANGTGIAFVTAGGGCIGCVLLASDPIVNAPNEFGFWASSFGLPSSAVALVGPDGLQPMLALRDSFGWPLLDADPDDASRRMPICR